MRMLICSQGVLSSVLRFTDHMIRALCLESCGNIYLSPVAKDHTAAGHLGNVLQCISLYS